MPPLFTNWILTKRRRCSLRFVLSAKNPGRMVMTYCQQLALIDIEMRACRWGSLSNGRAALLNSGRLSGMWSNASARPYRSAKPSFLAFNWAWSLSDSNPSVPVLLGLDLEMRLGFCFQICLYSWEFGTNHYGHVKGMSDLSTFQFHNWFDNHVGPFVNWLPLLRKMIRRTQYWSIYTNYNPMPILVFFCSFHHSFCSF